MVRFRGQYPILFTGVMLVLVMALAFACKDGGPSDPGINGNGGNGGGDNGEPTPTNSPMTVETQAPQSLQAGVDEGTWSFSVEDEDGIASVELAFTTPEGEHDFSVTITPGATSWDTTFSHTFSHTGEADFSWKVTDAFDGEPETQQGSEQTEITEHPANSPMAIEADGPDQLETGQQGTWSLAVEDPDGIAEIELEFATPGGEHDFEHTITPHSAQWDTTFTHSFSQAGEIVLSWTISDNYEFGEPEVQSGELQTTVAAILIDYTLQGTLTNTVLESPAAGVTARLRSPGGELLDQAESASDGTVSLSHSHPEDEPTGGFVIALEGTGYLDSELEADLAQETFTAELEPTPITFNASTQEVEPRGSILVDLTSLADGGEMEIEQITLEQVSENLSAEAENGTSYSLSVENDVAATTESITIRARTATNDQTGHVDVPIGQRASIAFTTTFFEMTEDDTLSVNLLEIVESGTDIDSTHISTQDHQLEILRDAANEYRLIPTKDFTGNIQLDLYASNKHGSETNTTGNLEVQALPRITITVQNNETNNHTTGLQAHIGVYDAQGSLTDTLTSNNGIFEIKDPQPNNPTKITARYIRGEEPFSYVRTDHIPTQTNNHLIRVVDYYIREQNGNITDELRKGEPGIANPEGFRKFAKGILRGGVSSWNNEPVQATEFGTFNCYTTSANGRGPDKLLVAEIFHRLDNGETSYLQERVKNIMLDVYENDIAPWMGEYAPPTEIADSLTFHFEDNQYLNIAINAPNSHPAPGEMGRVYVWGQQPNQIMNGQSRIRSDGEGTDAQIESATSQEGVAGFGFMSRTPANDWAEPDQSIVRNGNLLQRPSLFDGKLMRAVWEPTYTCTPTQVTYTKDVFGKPPE